MIESIKKIWIVKKATVITKEIFEEDIEELVYVSKVKILA